ncbi:hypothetical protein P3631_08380 [Vibrio parahaemolyticus]|uniref:hypothetical protein n=1 Tax=Vibrio TaxID=662 RepID=UPI00146EAF42|nr:MULTISPECIES: hypothetical protein [Vibrio]MDF5091225.1 hypothetical protein [Vibrio parahaemolyticus]MDF5135938.1 hypothetical protein [Vibrio parahaemolyticus]MDF5470384.1 hypothetical protein [Vibrio parahaemolyticus]MDW1852540.1 hypothetical protein [Vibrio sp. Vb0888]MDW1906802.1 hypothetical protein [Vibrio sp. 705]
MKIWLSLAFVFLLVVGLSYPVGLGIFGGLAFELTPKAWSDFATFFGGVSGPILSVMALVYIANTLKSQQESVIVSKKLIVINTLKNALERHFQSIEQKISAPYMNTGLSVERYFINLRNQREVAVNEDVIVATNLLVEIAYFSGNMKFYLERLRDIGESELEQGQLDITERLAYISKLSPYVNLLGFHANLDVLSPDQKEWLKIFKSQNG